MADKGPAKGGLGVLTLPQSPHRATQARTVEVSVDALMSSAGLLALNASEACVFHADSGLRIPPPAAAEVAYQLYTAMRFVLEAGGLETRDYVGGLACGFATRFEAAHRA